MGLQAVGVLDGDTSSDAEQFLQSNSSLADAVIRLPDNAAIEAALVLGVPEAILRQALADVAASASLTPPPELHQLSGDKLKTAAISFIKKHSLHAPFVEALPTIKVAPLAVEVLHQAVEAAAGAASGVIQL